MSHYARIKAIERKQGRQFFISESEKAEIDAMVYDALRDSPPLPENRLDECKTVREIEAEIERIVYNG